MVAAAEKVFAVRAKNIVLIPIQYFVAASFTVSYLSITDSICTAFELRHKFMDTLKIKVLEA